MSLDNDANGVGQGEAVESSDDENGKLGNYSKRRKNRVVLLDESDNNYDVDPSIASVDQSVLESSDDDAIFIKRNKTRTSKFLEGDSDDEGNEQLENMISNENGSRNNKVSDDDDNLPIVFSKKTRILRPLFDGKSSDDDNSQSMPDYLAKQHSMDNVRPSLEVSSDINRQKKRHKVVNNDSIMEGSSNSVNNDKMDDEPRKCAFLNDRDLFDAEESSDDDRRKEENDNDADDESISDIKKKVKDSLKQRRTSLRPKRENLQQLHSESQRLLRESRAKLPRHEPQKKTLDEFLSRHKMVPKSLKAAERDVEITLKKAIINVSSSMKDMVNESSMITIDESISNRVCQDISETPVAVHVSQTCESTKQLLDIDGTVNISIPRMKKTPVFVEEKHFTEFESGALQNGSGTKEIDTLKERISLLDARLISRIPKLTGTPQHVISLDSFDYDDNPSKNGVDDLINRFVKHTSVKKPKKQSENQQVILNVLKKNIDGKGQEQLVTETVAVNIKPIEDNYSSNQTPGSQLKLLKDSLKVTLAVKREEARKHRMLLYKMDNENESDEKNSVDEFKERILSDEIDTEDSDNGDDVDFDKTEKKLKRSEFVDDEAEDDDFMEDDSTADSANDNYNVVNAPTISLNVEDEGHRSSLARCNTLELFPASLAETAGSTISANSSFELIGSLIPAHQPGGGCTSNTDWDNDVYPTQNIGRGFGISQFMNNCESQSSQRQSQLSICGRLGLGPSIDSQVDNMDELFDLCSGKWAGPQKEVNVNLCEPASQSTQENEAELFGLCSGNFKDPSAFNSTESTIQETSQHSNLSRDLLEGDVTKSDDDDDDVSISSRDSLDVGHRHKRKIGKILSDTESDASNDDSSESEVEDHIDDEQTPRRNGGLEFFEKEAQLSGSDASSDEDDEMSIEDDILEEELGDQEYLSEDELREQVEKVHHKLVMDDDQRELRIYKELYLEDGELHSDEQARLRRFRWRNVGDSQGNDDEAKSDESDDGDVKDGDKIDADFRAQRHEREKWMTEFTYSQNDDITLNDNESQFGQLTKRITVLSKQDSHSFDMPPSVNPSKLPRKSLNLLNRGSFLARSKKYLAKLVELTKPLNGKNNESKMSGPSKSRNFVFTTVSPPKQPPPTSDSDLKPARLRRTATTPASSLTVSKRPRLDRTLSFDPDGHNQSSIFNLF